MFRTGLQQPLLLVAGSADCNRYRTNLSILASLNKGPLPYTEIQKKISQITERMLSLQLRELEHHGIITRKVFPEVSPRVVYTLTEAVAKLIPIILDLSAWGTSLRALHEAAAAQDNG